MSSLRPASPTVAIENTDGDLDADNEVVVAFCTEKTRVGISVFEAATNSVWYASHSFWSVSDLDWLLQRVFEQINHPNVILCGRDIAVSTETVLRQQLNLLIMSSGATSEDEARKASAETGDSIVVPSIPEDTSASVPTGVLKLIAKSNFSYARGCAWLDKINLQDMDRVSAPRGDHLRIGALVDLEDKVCVQALGALIGFLSESSRNALDTGGVTLSSLRRMNLGDFMHISADSFDALSIFSQDNHPSVVKGSGRAKEGFSLFALLDRAESVAGKRLLKQWMLRPLLNPEAIAERHNGVGQFIQLKAHHADAILQLKAWLRTVKDVERLMLRMSRVKATVGDWMSLRDTVNSLAAATSLAERLHQVLITSTGGETVEVQTVFSPILAASGTQLQWVQAMLAKVVDWAASASEGRLCVQHGLDSTLDEYRHTHADLSSFLAKITVMELKEYPALPGGSVAYIPQIGFLLCLDKSDFPDEGSLKNYPGLSFQYEIRDAVYFKTARMTELDEFFGDIASVITDMEDCIVRQLEEKILECSGMLSQLGHAFAQLDCVLSLADASYDLHFVRPEMVENNVLFIKNGRHPLQQIIVSTFVPNDTALSPGNLPGGVAVISGANYSGKSVYIKQAGLIAYLAQIGCFVPAERAILGITDRIFTRIHTVDSTLRPESTFTHDVHQVAQMLNHSTPRSLLLIDEFGKGTASVDGAALLLGIVEHLLARRLTTGTPKTLITTHFGDVFDYGLLSEGNLCELSFYQMEVLLEKTSDDTDQVTPLFRLMPGRSTSSFGIACARQAGIPECMLKRAVTVTECLRKREGVLPLNETPTQ